MSDDTARIRALIENWADAVHRGDPDAVLADHSPDIVMFDVPPPENGVHGIAADRETWPPFFTWQRQGASFESVNHASDLVTVDEHVGDLQVAVREDWCPESECSLGDPAVAPNQVGRKDAVPTSHSDSPSSCDATSSRLRPGHSGRCASCSIRTAAPAAAHAAGDATTARRGGRVPCLGGGECEYGRLSPQDLRGRDRRHSHRLDLDVGARLISVDLQEHVADAQGRALVMGHDDLDVFHGCHCRDMTIDVSSGLSRATVEVIEIGEQVRPPDPSCQVQPAFDVDGHLLTTSKRETGSTRSGACKPVDKRRPMLCISSGC